MAEFDSLDEFDEPDPPWTTQYTVQDLDEVPYEYQEHIPPQPDQENVGGEAQPPESAPPSSPDQQEDGTSDNREAM